MNIVHDAKGFRATTSGGFALQFSRSEPATPGTGGTGAPALRLTECTHEGRVLFAGAIGHVHSIDIDGVFRFAGTGHGYETEIRAVHSLTASGSVLSVMVDSSLANGVAIKRSVWRAQEAGALLGIQLDTTITAVANHATRDMYSWMIPLRRDAWSSWATDMGNDVPIADVAVDNSTALTGASLTLRTIGRVLVGGARLSLAVHGAQAAPWYVRELAGTDEIKLYHRPQWQQFAFWFFGETRSYSSGLILAPILSP